MLRIYRDRRRSPALTRTFSGAFIDPAQTYGQILAQIGWAPRQDFDRLIGAHALASGCTLVTANSSDFSDIPGLTLADWTLAA